MKLHFDERLARPITAVDPRHTGFQGFEQFGQFIQATAQIRQINVVGIFHTDRLTPTVVVHQPVIDPTGQTPQSLAKTAELAHQRQLVPLAQVLAVDDPQLAELVGGDLADAVQLAHRQTADKLLHLIRRNNEQAVGLFPVTGDFCQKLVRRHARRHGDVQLIGDPPANVLGNACGTAAEMRAIGNIQISLIQRQRFNQVGVVAEDRVYFFRRFAIGVHARLDDGQVRAQLQSMSRSHRRTHAIGPRFVIAGGDHPAPVRRTTHRQRLAGQTRVIAHLDGGVETVAVNVDDFSLSHVRKGNVANRIGSISLTPVYSTSGMNVLSRR
ncbi:hypothetical protein D3C72_1300630 [compost metagenome]